LMVCDRRGLDGAKFLGRLTSNVVAYTPGGVLTVYGLTKACGLFVVTGDMVVAPCFFVVGL
jgi:hypothetical protein